MPDDQNPDNDFEKKAKEQIDFLFDEHLDSSALEQLALQLEWRWADFHMEILSPKFAEIIPPARVEPKAIPNQEQEFVYTIIDHGYKLSCSKGEEMYSAGMAMCKLYYTIEKMISLLIDKLKSDGISTETEVQVSFAGFELARRKAFESIINLNYNVVVTNFDPGNWGERYLQTVQRMAEKGYGYPPPAPRDSFKVTSAGPSEVKRK